MKASNWDPNAGTASPAALTAEHEPFVEADERGPLPQIQFEPLLSRLIVHPLPNTRPDRGGPRLPTPEILPRYLMRCTPSAIPVSPGVGIKDVCHVSAMQE